MKISDESKFKRLTDVTFLAPAIRGNYDGSISKFARAAGVQEKDLGAVQRFMIEKGMCKPDVLALLFEHAQKCKDAAAAAAADIDLATGDRLNILRARVRDAQVVLREAVAELESVPMANVGITYSVTNPL